MTAHCADKDGVLYPLPQEAEDAERSSDSDSSASSSRMRSGVQVRRVGGILVASCLLAAGIVVLISTSLQGRPPASELSAQTDELIQEAATETSDRSPCGRCKGTTPFCDTTVKKCVPCAEGAKAAECKNGLTMVTDGAQFEFQFDLKVLEAGKPTPIISVKDGGLFSKPAFELFYTGFPAQSALFNMYTGFAAPFDKVDISSGKLEAKTPYTISIYKDLSSLCILTKAQTSSDSYDEKNCVSVQAAKAGILKQPWSQNVAKFGMKPQRDLFWPDVTGGWLSKKKKIDVSNYAFVGGCVPVAYELPNLNKQDDLLSVVSDQQDAIRLAMAGILPTGAELLVAVADSATATTEEMYTDQYEIYGSRRRLLAKAYERRLGSAGAMVQASVCNAKKMAPDVGYASTPAEFQKLVSDLASLGTSEEFGTLAATKVSSPPATIQWTGIAEDTKTKCSKWSCPAGTKQATKVSCKGFSCLTKCCLPVTCMFHKCPKPYKPQLLNTLKKCFGEADCLDTCCVGECKTWQCSVPPTNEVPFADVTWPNSIPEFVTRCNKWLVFPYCKPSSCATTCCITKDPPCCTDPFLAECAACMECKSKHAYCSAKDEGKTRRLGEPTEDREIEVDFDDHEETDSSQEAVEKVALAKNGDDRELIEKYNRFFAKNPTINMEMYEDSDAEAADRFLKDPQTIPLNGLVPLQNASSMINGGFSSIIEKEAKNCLDLTAQKQTTCINTKIGCLTDIVGQCPYSLKSRFVLHRGLKLKPNAVNSIRVLTDGRTVITGGDDKLAFLWTADDGKMKQILGDPGNSYGPYSTPISRVAVMPNVIDVVVATQDGHIETLHIVDGLRKGAGITTPNNAPVLSLTAFTNWDLIGVGTADNYTYLYNYANTNFNQIPSGFVNADAALASINNTITLGLQKAGILQSTGMEQLFASRAFGAERCIGMKSKECQLLQDAFCAACNTGTSLSPLACAICNGGDWTSGWSIQAMWEKWYAETADKVNYDWDNNVPFEHYLKWGHASCIVYFPVNLRFATAYGDGKIRYWNANSGKLLMTMWGHTGPVTALWALPTTLNVVSGGADGTIRIWHAPSGIVWRIMYTGSPVTSLTVIPDTGNLYSGHEDGYVRMWKVKTGVLVCKWPTFTKWSKLFGKQRINDIAHNPGSNSQILTASADGIARVWDARK